MSEGGRTHVSDEPSYNRHVEPSKESQQQRDSEFGELCRIYETEIGSLSPVVADKLRTALDDYALDWITQAISRAVEMNNRRWAYVQGILKNWAAVGGPQNDSLRRESKSKTQTEIVSDAEAKRQLKNF